MPSWDPLAHGSAEDLTPIAEAEVMPHDWAITMWAEQDKIKVWNTSGRESDYWTVQSLKSDETHSNDKDDEDKWTPEDDKDDNDADVKDDWTHEEDKDGDDKDDWTVPEDKWLFDGVDLEELT